MRLIRFCLILTALLVPHAGYAADARPAVVVAVNELPRGLEPADDTGNVEVIMTLTSMGCPLGPVIERDVKSTVGTIPGVKNTKMTLTFSPPWDPSRMTEDARMELGYWG